jgi:hypothetical protein
MLELTLRSLLSRATSYNKDSYRVFDLSALDIKMDDPLPPHPENSKDLDAARHLMARGYARMGTSLLHYYAACSGCDFTERKRGIYGVGPGASWKYFGRF